MVNIEQKYGKNQEESKNFSVCRQNVSPKLIDKMTQDHNLKPLAAFYCLKRNFTNSVLYNYKGRMSEFATLIGCSEKTLYTYFRTLRRYGLISEVKNSIVMAGTRKTKAALKDRKKACITISENDTIKNIVTELRGKTLYDHRDRTLRAVQMDQYEKKHFNLRRDYPCKMSSGEFHDKKKNESFRPSISIRNLAKVFNVSNPTAVKIKRDLNDRGIINSRTPIHRLLPVYLGSSHLPPQRYAEDVPGYIYKHENGFVYTCYGDTHDFIEYPNYLTEMTHKQYFAIKKWSKKHKPKLHNVNEL